MLTCSVCRDIYPLRQKKFKYTTCIIINTAITQAQRSSSLLRGGFEGVERTVPITDLQLHKKKLFLTFQRKVLGV